MIHTRTSFLLVALSLIILSNLTPTAFAADTLRVDASLEVTSTDSARLQKIFPYLNVSQETTSSQDTDVADILTPFSTPQTPLVLVSEDKKETLPDGKKVFKNVHTGEKVLPISAEYVKGISTFFSRFHPGIDMRANIGTPVRAMLPGIVTEIGFDRSGYGKYIVVTHKQGDTEITSLYAHLRSVDTSLGDQVEASTKIGEVGLTGHTTGPHLHLEIHQKNNVAIDPIKFLSGSQIAKK
jgi:murein DD-endopeptidase MepM/ murein hydrolase activator NlpD